MHFKNYRTKCVHLGANVFLVQSCRNSYTAKRDIKWKNHELVWKQNFKYWINLENLKKLLTLLIIMFFLQTNLRPLKNFCLFFKWSQIGFGFLSLSFLSSKTFDSQMFSLNWKFKEEDQMQCIFGRIGNSRETFLQMLAFCSKISQFWKN